MCLVKCMYKKIVSFCSLLLLFVLVLTGCNFNGKKKNNTERYWRVVEDVYKTAKSHDAGT